MPLNIDNRVHKLTFIGILLGCRCCYRHIMGFISRSSYVPFTHFFFIIYSRGERLWENPLKTNE